MPTKTRIAFRRKKNSRQAIAAIKTVRLAGRTSPKSLHLGYVSLQSGLTDERLDQLDARLREKWLELVGYEEIYIDREDAHVKWARIVGDRDEDCGPEGGGGSQGPAGPSPQPSSRQPATVVSDKRAADTGLADRMNALDPIIRRMINLRLPRSLRYLTDVDDVMQDVFSAIWSYADRDRVAAFGESALRAYIGRVVQNTIIDLHKRQTSISRGGRQVHLELDETAAADQESHEELVERREEMELLTACISELSPEQNSLMVERMRGASIADLAKRLGLSERTAVRRYLGAVRTLSQLMKERTRGSDTPSLKRLRDHRG